MAGGLKDSPCIHLAINLWCGTEFFMNKPITLEHALATSNTFCKANIGMLETLASLAVPVQLQAQQHLFFAGDEARHFYWISNGSITLYSPSFVGENKIFRTLGPGSLVAESVMYATPSTYPLSAVAEQSCLLYRMPRDQLLTMTRQSPDFAFSLVEVMASRISQAVNRIDLLTITNSSQRLRYWRLATDEEVFMYFNDRACGTASGHRATGRSGDTCRCIAVRGAGV